MNLPVDILNKTFSTYELRNKLLQGETGVDTATIVLPLIYDADIDLSILNFTVRGTYVANPTSVARASLTKVVGEEDVTLTWAITSDFTDSSGEMILVLVGSDADGNIVFKLNGGSISIREDASETATETITPSLAEQYAAQIEQGLVEIDGAIDACVEATATANEFTNLSHTHSNKTALDLVSGTNTGDQDLSNYAELTDLHEHSNKSALDLVSGTNTGDQDLSSYAKASDLHEHANKSALDLVSGTNTGDQDLSSYAKTTDLHSHANKTALDNVSGTNTGDQNASTVAYTPSTYVESTNVQNAITEVGDSVGDATAILAAINGNGVVVPTQELIDDSITAHNSNASAHSAQISGAISTHNNDAGAHAGQFAPINAQLATDAITHMLATEMSGAYEGVDLSVRFATEIASYSDVWAWIKARVQSENFVGLHVHDYITVTCSNAGAYVLKMEIAGINTYKGSGGTEIPAHIDWISKDCWPDTVQYNLVDFNNGIGCDKFTATAGQTTFQLTYRGTAYPAAITSMTVNGVANTNFTYISATGIMTYTGSALSAGAVVKTFWSAVPIPFMASNLNAYMNSLKMGVPNEAALDPFLTEIDYSVGGIYYYLPIALKNVISLKRAYAAGRYAAGSLLTTDPTNHEVLIGPLWIPEEIEVYGFPMLSVGTYDKWYARQYPVFAGGNRKKGAGNGGTRSSWWLLSAYTGTSTYFCPVLNSGHADSNLASTTLRTPVCFRIAKT